MHNSHIKNVAEQNKHTNYFRSVFNVDINYFV